MSAAMLAVVCIEQSSLEALGERVTGFVSRSFDGKRAETLRTALGERKSTSLEDGSQIVLNTSTLVETAMRDELRDVTLVHGEALLDVAEDMQRPLVFHMGATELQTTAAKLHVRREADGTGSIHVLTGGGVLRPVRQVGRRFINDAYLQPVALRAGQSVSIRRGVRIISTFDAEGADRALAWTQGEIWLLGDTLGDAAAEFNRYNHRKLVVGDASIEGLRIGGRFDANDLDSFVDGLNSAFGIQAVTIRSGGAGASAVVLVGPRHTRRAQRQ